MSKRKVIKASFVLVLSILVILVFLGIISLLVLNALADAKNLENPGSFEWTDIVGGVLSMWSFILTVYLGWRAFIGACVTIHKYRKSKKQNTTNKPKNTTTTKSVTTTTTNDPRKYVATY